MLDPNPVLPKNQCGSETLQKTLVNVSYKHKGWEEERRVKGSWEEGINK
jgi:hypothetical protein